MNMNTHQLMRMIQMLTRRSGRKTRMIAGIVIGLVMGYGFLQPIIEKRFGISLPSISSNQSGGRSHSQSNSQTRTGAAVGQGEQSILSAFEQRKSDIMVEVDVVVKKNLPDDDVGSRHQKMILALPSGHTVLLAHNIDLAKRVPADEGDTIRVKGEYEFSDQGGVLHWTHHDPGGRHEDGWIEYNGQRYE